MAAVATFSGSRRNARFAGPAQWISNGAPGSQPGGAARGDLGIRLADGRNQLGVAEDGQGLLQGLEVLEAEDDSGRTTVLGDHDAAMLAFEAVDHLGEAVLHVGEGDMLCCAHGQKYG